MPRYLFNCRVCQLEKEHDLPISKVCSVGETMAVYDLNETPQDCSACSTNKWQRVWGRKAPSVVFSFRRTGL